MSPTTFNFKETHDNVHYTTDTMNSSFNNSALVLKNSSVQKNTYITVISASKTVFTGTNK